MNLVAERGWTRSLAVGDLVLVVNAMGNIDRVTVERVTAARVIVRGTQYDKGDPDGSGEGYEYGTRNSRRARCYIYPVTPENEQALAAIEAASDARLARTRLVNEVHAAAALCPSVDHLNRALTILNEGTP